MYRSIGVLLLLIGGLALGALGGHTTTAQPGIAYPPGWNLVAGPEGSHLVGAAGPIYTLQFGDMDYEKTGPQTALVACHGYWAYFPVGGSLDTTGSSPRTSCAVVPAPNAWLMAGNPGTDTVTVNNATVAYIYTPADGYQATQSLKPGQGVWVAAAGRVDITALPSAASGTTTTTYARAQCWDGTRDAGPDPATICAGHGGVAIWIDPAPTPQPVSSADRSG